MNDGNPFLIWKHTLSLIGHYEKMTFRHIQFNLIAYFLKSTTLGFQPALTQGHTIAPSKLLNLVQRTVI